MHRTPRRDSADAALSSRLPGLGAAFLLGAGLAAVLLGFGRAPSPPAAALALRAGTQDADAAEQEEEAVKAPPPRLSAAGAASAPPTLRSKLWALFRRRGGVYVNKARYPRLQNTLMVTMANWGFREFFFNWECYARQLGFDYIVLSMDEKLHQYLGEDRSILMDKMQGKQEWGTDSYFDLGCHKLEAIKEIISLGADVFFSDPDNVFLRDPQRSFKEATDGFYDALFQADHPTCSDRANCPVAKQLAAGKLINGGFYYWSARRQPQMISLLQRSIDFCHKKPRSKMCCDDQQAVNKAVYEVPQSPQTDSFVGKPVFCGNQDKAGNITGALQYCIFEPLDHPAGRHEVDMKRVQTLHSNWVLLAQNKVRMLQKYNMWQYVDGKCLREGMDENQRCPECTRYEMKPATPPPK